MGNISQARTNRQSRTPNSKSFEEAKNLSERFHGREVESIVNVIENYSEPHNLAELGILEELVVNPLHSKYEYPINFESQQGDEEIRLASHPNAKQLYCVGGNQNIDRIVEDIMSDSDSNLVSHNRHYIILGECISVAYWTSKHHLAGPRPLLIYDWINKRLMLLGGSYEVRDVGIWN